MFQSLHIQVIKPSNLPQKSAKGDPAALHLTSESIENFVGEEAPEARAGPRNPDAFYRGEEAGAVPNPTDNHEMEQLRPGRIKEPNWR